LPPITEGEVLIKILWLGMDPAMRLMMGSEKTLVPQMVLGEPVKGFSIGRIVESKAPQYESGAIVTGLLEWSDYSIWTPHTNFPIAGLDPVDPRIPKISYALGALSIVGLTAYFGITEVSQLKQGETILISSAAGGVGTIAGQIAKIIGARVIGLSSSEEKLKTLTDGLGFDAAIDYKSPRFLEEFKLLMPNGPDVYYDNVGGKLSQVIMSNMKRPARVTECGQIATYDDPGGGWTVDIRQIHRNGLRFEGFQPLLFEDKFPQALGQLVEWIEAGKIKVIETEWNGLDSAPKAMIAMLTGRGVGKHVVKLE
jgi:NADPH-dependent curcumin reductase CurA